MNPDKLAAAIGLSIKSALDSKETSIHDVIAVLELHKHSLIASVLNQPVIVSRPNGANGVDLGPRGIVPMR